jgi:dCTP deaminase
MILSGREISAQVEAGAIVIDPFRDAARGTNSYDLSLGRKLIAYTGPELDFRVDNPVHELFIPDEGLVLAPQRLYLGHTVEVLGSNKFVPILKGRSSTARLGLFVHLTADLIDIGSIGQWTLQLYPIHAVRIYPNMPIAQATFWTVKGEVELYDGKYQGARGPMRSHAFLDFRKPELESQQTQLKY